MMYGLDETYDAVFYVGYHAPAGDPGSPSAIRLRGASNFIELNGKRMSEFMLNTYTAAMYGVPVLFLSGDGGSVNFQRAGSADHDGGIQEGCGRKRLERISEDSDCGSESRCH